MRVACNVVPLQTRNAASDMSPEVRDAMANCCIRLTEALDNSITDRIDRCNAAKAHDCAADLLGWPRYQADISPSLQHTMIDGAVTV